jgi:response regulator NasT
MHPCKVVIVDDEPITRLDVKEMLLQEGFHVVGEGKNGEEAIQLVHMWQPDLVVMDIKMPHMDGIKAARILRNHASCAVLLLTAFSQKDLVDQAIDAGVIAYLVKPVTEENFIPAVRVALQQHRRYRSLQSDLSAETRKLEVRKVVEIAKGNLMERMNCSEREAYRWLQSQSMAQGIPIAELAKQYLP